VRSEARQILGRLWRGLVDLLPTGGIGERGRAPDIDGRRDTDSDHRRAVLTAKSQMSPDGQATTSYEPVDRSNVDDG